MTIIYLKKTSRIDVKIWNFENLTARRFTAELIISDKMWQTFLNEKSTHESLPAGECAPNHVGL